jgi:hypothetical protein
MAQGQTASARRSRSQKKPSTRSRGSSNSKSRKRTNSKPKQTTSKASKSSPVSAVENTAKEAGRTAKDAGRNAGKTVGRTASKAKVPLLAGGAALAGAAGGIALGAHQARRHKGIGKVVKPDNLARAAKRVGDFGAQMGHFANELQLAREASNGHGRSPVEVVLEGLTTRRSRH